MLPLLEDVRPVIVSRRVLPSADVNSVSTGMISLLGAVLLFRMTFCVSSLGGAASPHESKSASAYAGGPAAAVHKHSIAASIMILRHFFIAIPHTFIYVTDLTAY